MSNVNEDEVAVEITPPMIEAGLYTLYGYDITDPNEAEIRIAIADVFRSMERIRRLDQAP
jgi:hypothetical protein